MTLKNTIKDYIFKELKYGFLFKKRLGKIRTYHQQTPLEYDELESEMLSSHIRNAYKNSLFYKQLYDKHGVNINQVQTRADLAMLPIIRKEDIKKRVDDLYIGNRYKHTSYTSGTSGSPLKVYYDLNCVLNEAAYNEIFRNSAGHCFGQRVVSLRGVLDKSKLYYMDKHSNTLYLSSYNLNNKNIKLYIQLIRDFKPNAILAYPSSLEILSNLLIEEGDRVEIPLAFTSSETLYSYQREKIEKTLKTKIFDRYGNAERTISLIQKPKNGHYIEPKLYSINEYKTDNIITTNLINRSFPLIRYQVNDSVVLKSDRNGNKFVSEVIGRIDDFLVTIDGTKIGRMDLVFKGVNNIRYAQIIQNDTEDFFVHIVKDDTFSRLDENIIRENIIKRIGNKTNFSFKYIEENDLIKTKRNKFKLVINNIRSYDN